MRVTIDHRQESTGLGSKTSQFVDCVVLFSEEEKAIIKVRGLNDHVIVVDPPSPPPSYREYMTAGVLQGFAPFFVLVGILLVISGIFAGGRYAIIGALMVILTPLGWGIGFLMDRYMNVRFTHPKQHISVRAMLAGPFRVYSPDPAYSDLVVDQIRERLTFLKHTIVGSAICASARATNYETRAMSLGDWLRWPNKNTDPALTAAITVLLIMVAMLAVIISASILIPVVAGVVLFKAFQWYVQRPVPTDRLYAETEQRIIAAKFPEPDRYLDDHIDRLLDAVEDDLPAYGVFRALMATSETLYEKENLNNPLPPLAITTAIEEGRYRDSLIDQQRKSVDAPRTLKVFNDTVSKAYIDFIRLLPAIAKATPEQFSQRDTVEPFSTFPLVDVLTDGSEAVSAVLYPFLNDEAAQIGLFAGLRRQIERNLRDATPLDKHKGTTREIVADYLHHTDIQELFYAPVPFTMTDQQRYEHSHVVGGSGHGKTQLLQHLIVNDLERPQPPALIIVDSQGEMLSKIQWLAAFAPGGKLADKLICIDPEDIDHSPALNMFASPSRRVESYSKAVKEQVEAGTIELFNYIFGAIAAELTSRQNTTFAYVTRLMLTIPDATIHTLRELFEDNANSIDASLFAPYIRALDNTAQGFFENQFFTKTYAQTKSQIARRLYGVLQVASFDRMFSARDNKLDMFEAMQSGCIVLVNTSKALLKTEASALFGRYMIARVIAAAFERIALPAQQRNPAFLIVDEAAEYFDESLETLLSQARKFNVGVVFAHQHLDQLTPGLRSSVAANTSIKFAGGVSDRDARAVASDMRTSPDFITGMTKRAKATEFACYVRNHTGSAVRLTIPFGTLEAAPKMSKAEHDRMIATNRERFAAGPDRSRPTAPDREQPAPEAPDAAPSDDWRS